MKGATEVVTQGAAEMEMTEVRYLRGVGQALDMLRQKDTTMSIQAAVVFLDVATHEGGGIAGIVERTGMPSSTVSRSLSYLGRFAKFQQAGMDWVRSSEDPQDRRSKIVELTPQGKKLAAALTDALKTALAEKPE